MSDAKPFAEVKPETSVADAEGYAVVVGDETLCPPWGNYSALGAGDVAGALNAAVARARREAAAEALEEAAKKWPKGRGKFDSGDFGLWLEAEASALRKGDG